MRPVSLRWKIQRWHTLLLAVVTTTLLLNFYIYERRARVRRLDAALTRGVVEILPRFAEPALLPGATAVADPRPEERRERDGYYIVVWAPSGEVTYRSPQAPDAVPWPDRRGPVWLARWNGGNREVIEVHPSGHALLVGMSAEQVRKEMRGFALTLVGIGAGVMLLGVAGGSWISRRAVRPIEEISAVATQIAAGEHAKRITPPANAATELRELAMVLNQTFDRLAAAHAEQVRFTADASHELATPVSIIVSQLQVALEQPRTPERYVQTLEACLRAGGRMRKLIRDLLDLAAYDAGQAMPRLVECDLAEVVRESLEFVAPLAEERGATIAERLESVRARVDPFGISQAVINLLTNALRHNAPGVRAEVSLRAEGERAVIVVRDFGAGISGEALPHLFARFYRVDRARRRDAGGSGLGLAITRAIIEAHDGEIVAANVNPGAAFTITLPMRCG